MARFLRQRVIGSEFFFQHINASRMEDELENWKSRTKQTSYVATAKNMGHGFKYHQYAEGSQI